MGHLPVPHTVLSPRTQSTGSEGTGKGLQRSWFGVMVPPEKSAVRESLGKLTGWNGSWVTEGRMR